MKCIGTGCDTIVSAGGVYCRHHEDYCCDCEALLMKTKGDCANGCACKCLSRAEVDDLAASHFGTIPSPRYLRRLAITAQVAMDNMAETCREVTLANERVELVEAEMGRLRQQLGALSPRSAYTETGVQMACVVAVDGKLQVNAGHERWCDVRLQVPNAPSIKCCVCRLCGVIYKPDD